MSTLILEETEVVPMARPPMEFGPPQATIPVVLGPKLNRTQVPIVAGFMPVSLLIPNFVVPHRIPFTKEGYQRLPQEGRINELAADLRSKRVDLPTSILLNVRNREAKRAVKDGVLDLGFVGEANRLGVRWPTNKFYVVDGQHRVLALQKLVNEPDGAQWLDFQIPFVCMLGATEEEEMDQFYTVNSKAKSVRTDLAYELLTQRANADEEVMKSLVERGQEWQVKAQMVVEKLAEDSPVWRHRIRFASMEKEDTIMPSASMVTSIKPLLGSPFFKMVSIDHQVRIIDAFWRGLREVLQEAFDRPSEFSLQKGVGVIVMHTVLVQVLEIVRAQGLSPIEPDSYVKVLREPLMQLQGEDAEFNTVSGLDFWRVVPRGAAGSYSSSAGRRVLIAKIINLLPRLDVE